MGYRWVGRAATLTALYSVINLLVAPWRFILTFCCGVQVGLGGEIEDDLGEQCT